MSEDHQGPEGERLEREGGKLIHKGPIVSVRMDRFRYPDGSTDVRQVVVHPGAVAIVAYDARSVYLVRQPREPVEEAALLELPAGRLDKEGESPLEAAQRELREEIGKSAGDWTELRRFYTSPGFRERAGAPVHGDRALRRARRARGRRDDRDHQGPPERARLRRSTAAATRSRSSG